MLLDTRGTPLRSKAFHDTSYGWAPSAGNTDDYAAAIRQLTKRYVFMDADRIGIYSVFYRAGLQNFLERQDIYKVHIQGGCVMDARLIGASVVGDVWEGCEGPSEERCYPEDLAENLQGKLLVIHAINNHNAPCYPPATALRLLDALQRADKDFDMLMLPGTNESYGAYTTRRIWDYLVEHLAQEVPPKGVEFKASMF